MAEQIPPGVVLPALLAVHVFSGPRRENDLCAEWTKWGWYAGFQVHTLSLDLSLSPSHNILDDEDCASMVCETLQGWCTDSFYSRPAILLHKEMF